VLSSPKSSPTPNSLFSFFSLFLSAAYGFLSLSLSKPPLPAPHYFLCVTISKTFFSPKCIFTNVFITSFYLALFLLRLSFLLIKKLIDFLLSSFFSFISRKNICITVSASSSKHAFRSSFQTILLHHNRFPTYFSLFLSSEYSDHLDSTCWMHYSSRNSIQSGNHAYLFLFFHFFFSY